MTVDNRLRVAKIILGRLLDGEMRRTELEKAVISESPTYATVRSALNWLLRNDYVIRVRRGVYKITEKGIIFYRAI